MALPSVLFAGDSNLKFVQWFVPATDRDQLKVVTVSGASAVRDVTDFRGYLEEAALNFRPEELYLHLGSNDVSRETSPRRVYWELRQLIDDVREIVPDVRVKLCSVLPRSRSAYKDERWNRFVLPELQDGVFMMNCVLQDLCDEQGFEYVDYNLQLHHFGVDGLHVWPSGAKHLLSTILGKNKEEPVSMPYERVPCNVSFGWDDTEQEQTVVDEWKEQDHPWKDRWPRQKTPMSTPTDSAGYEQAMKF